MTTEYATAVNIIAVLSTIIGFMCKFYIYYINKREKSIRKATSTPTSLSVRTPREEAKQEVHVPIFGILSLLFVITVVDFIDTLENDRTLVIVALVESMSLIIYDFAVWLPVEVSVIAMVGGLLYIILQYEGFTTG